MKKYTAAILRADIEKRLGDIAFHFEERHSLCCSISSYTEADSTATGPRKTELDRVIARIKREEDNLLLKLVHLKDSVDNYFKASGLDPRELNVVDLFKPYRLASNYININKHGLRGRSAKTAVHDYSMLVFEQEGDPSSPIRRFAGYITLINYEGELYQTLHLILDLVRIWELFLRNHSEIDADDFIRRISKVQSALKGQSTYSAPVPEGMLRDAKRLALERKSLDIK